jgi:hypothetical protein
VSLRAASSFAAINAMQLLFVLRSANLQVTTDQQFQKIFGGSAYQVSQIIARQRTGAASVLCAGGIYDAASKGGNIIAAAAQSWVTLASGIIVTVPVASLLQTTLLSATPYFSLTTASTAACTADVYIFGIDLT